MVSPVRGDVAPGAPGCMWEIEPVGLDLDRVRVSIDGIDIVMDAVMRASPGEMIGLIGPNGSGKSTLLRTVYRSLRPMSGAVWVGGDDVWAMPAKEAARRTAAVAQEASSDFDFSVREVVDMGRGPHKRLWERETSIDVSIVDDALQRVSMTGFTDRVFATLSGGEKQRVLVARSLAQRSQLLVLDEPTNHLDVRAQFELLDLVRSLGVTTVAALHDLNLAARYCDRVYVLQRGRIVADGPTASVLTAALLEDVFGVSAHCGIDETGAFHVSLRGAARVAPNEGVA